MKTNNLRRAGFTVVETLIVVTVIGLLAAIAIPNFIVAGRTNKERKARNACGANLKLIEGAKRSWAFDNKKRSNETVTDADLFGADAYIRTKPFCPTGGQYDLGKVGEDPTCTVGKHVLPPPKPGFSY